MDKYKLEKLRARYEEKRLWAIAFLQIKCPEDLKHDSLEMFEKERSAYFAALDEMSQKEGEKE